MKITVVPIILICAAGMLACSGSKNSTLSHSTTSTSTTKVAVSIDSLDRALDVLDPEFTITRLSQKDYSFSFTAGAGGKQDDPAMGALRSIDSVRFQAFAPDGQLIDSRSTNDISSSGTMNRETGNASIIASTIVRWSPRESLPSGSYAQMTVYSRNGIIKRRRNFPEEESSRKKPLVMSLDVENRGSGVEFRLTVERTAPAPAGEYLPSGELYRIEIESSVGETLWSSSEGKAYIQSIGQVEPKNVGEKTEYRIYWDGISTLMHKRLEPGTYRIVATIPAKPAPYVLREEFTWSGQ